MKKALLTLVLIALSNTAFAATTIECGSGLDAVTGQLQSTQFVISSEDDIFEGASGGSWELKINGKVETGASLVEHDGQTTVTKIDDYMVVYGGVGTKLVITHNPNDRFFSNAIEYKIGSPFPNDELPVANLQCVRNEVK